VQFFDAALRQIPTRRTSPETKFGERSSDAVQAYTRVRAEHGKRRALPSPEFSLNARIPTLPNCVQEADFNLASTALQNCTTSVLEAFGKTSRPHRVSTLSPRMGQSSVARDGSPETDAGTQQAAPDGAVVGTVLGGSSIQQQECGRSFPVQRYG
tara:strand:+ start:47368 stop:47832 length:465 start_codon:yes stop_codon:yes gene_type:complete